MYKLKDLLKFTLSKEKHTQKIPAKELHKSNLKVKQ